MKLTRDEILKKKILDAQEMVRDYEVYSKDLEDEELVDLFKKFAEDSGIQAATLKNFLDKKSQ